MSVYGLLSEGEENGGMVDITAASRETRPRAFISYSSGATPEHDEWVLRLATRLTQNGVEVVLDRWDVGLGDDLAHFMEQGLAGADRVIAVCSDAFIKKADAGTRGVGYEKKIMTAPMMETAIDNHVVPVIRDATGGRLVPQFLSGTLYVDFRDDEQWDAKYRELLHDLYGERINPKPALGPNPFAAATRLATEQAINFDQTLFSSNALEGTVTFPSENNNGSFTIGTGVNQFTLKTSTAGAQSVHVYDDPADIASIALVEETPLEDVRSPETYDHSSRSRTPRVGDCVVLINVSGMVAVIEIVRAEIRETSADRIPRLTFRYKILDGV
jgi:hypothetical protein